MIDLQNAVAELSRLPLADHTLESLMAEICRLVVDLVPGAAEVSVTIVEGDHAWTAAFSGPMALALDERQYALGHGPCVDGAVSGTRTEIPDMATETRWADYAPAALARGARSSMGVPIPVQREVVAAINIYGTEPYAFDSTGVALAEEFAGYAGVALANLSHIVTAQQTSQALQEAMHSRAVIEQAKGMLMGDRRVTADAAFDLLVALSQASGRPLRDEAQALVDDAAGGPGP